MTLLERVAQALSVCHGAPVTVTQRRDLAGGCIGQASQLHTSHGTYFLKSHPDDLPGLFSAEAEGLRLMASSDTSLTIPEVISHEDPAPGRPGFIILQYLSPGRPRRDFSVRLGRGLAELHRYGSARGYGLNLATYCGTTRQDNDWLPTWIDFYATRRLEPLVRHLAEAGAFSAAQAGMARKLLQRLPELLAGPVEPPSLLHGDLWSGNVVCTQEGTPALIDPAACFAHREAELGMMTLFGGFDEAVYAAYEEVRPLAPGWRARNPLYQLYHVMNHAHLFGGNYVSSALDIIRRYV